MTAIFVPAFVIVAFTIAAVVLILCLRELRRLRSEVAHYRAVSIRRLATIVELSSQAAANKRSGLFALPVCSREREKN